MSGLRIASLGIRWSTIEPILVKVFSKITPLILCSEVWSKQWIAIAPPNERPCMNILDYLRESKLVTKLMIALESIFKPFSDGTPSESLYPL